MNYSKHAIIKGDSTPSKDICNLVEDIILLGKKIENVKFVYCKRSTNILTDRIAKKAIHVCTPKSYHD